MGNWGKRINTSPCQASPENSAVRAAAGPANGRRCTATSEAGSAAAKTRAIQITARCPFTHNTLPVAAAPQSLQTFPRALATMTPSKRRDYSA
ncbi:MAG: hypothetical protein HC888_14830 [Candidatus Competibacteraceae bacterium]|nr:hypothetical protein [Candidatus Competibacteraceae bacterium]